LHRVLSICRSWSIRAIQCCNQYNQPMGMPKRKSSCGVHGSLLFQPGKFGSLFSMVG
jgi:hypothetical protein